MSSPIKNLAIVGASGNIGSKIVEALLASSQPPTITAITREDSNAKFDTRLKVVKGSSYMRLGFIELISSHQAPKTTHPSSLPLWPSKTL